MDSELNLLHRLWSLRDHSFQTTLMYHTFSIPLIIPFSDKLGEILLFHNKMEASIVQDSKARLDQFLPSVEVSSLLKIGQYYFNGRQSESVFTTAV